MKTVQSITELKGEHYCIDLPFRDEDPLLPNNRCAAEQRLQGPKKKFERDVKYKEEYTSFLSDMLKQGYAEMVPTPQLEQEDGKVWYITHHGVHHPTKDKLVKAQQRMVSRYICLVLYHPQVALIML